MPIFLFILLAVATAAWFRRSDLRREMVWAGVLAVPLVVIEYALVGWSAPFDPMALTFRVGTVMSFAAVAAVLYEWLFRRVLIPTARPDRSMLGWLLTGPVVFGLGVMMADWPWLVALAVALAVEALAIIIRRVDLLWDLVVSAAGMAVVYATAWLLTGRVGGGDAADILFHDRVIGITVFGLPIEGLLVALLFGAVWGPLYAVAKHRAEPATVNPPLGRRVRLVVAIVVLIMTGAGTAWGASQFAIPPVLRTMIPTNGSTDAPLQQPIVFGFTGPINRDAAQLSVTPEVAGTWTFRDPAYGERAYRTIVFTPETIFQPAATYQFYLRGIASLAGTGRRDYRRSVTTAALPSMIETSLSTTAIEPCQPLKLPLDAASDPVVTWLARLEPAAAFTTSVTTNPPALVITPKDCLSHAATYRLVIDRLLQARSTMTNELVQIATATVFDGTVTTSDPPNLTDLTPSGLTVSVTTPVIRLEFGRAMPPTASAAMIIEPLPAGNWAWETPQTLSYTLSAALTHDTTYRVTIPVGTKDAAGGFFTAAVTRSFTTIGAAVASISPANGAGGVSVETALTIDWNQSVDHAQAERAITIRPEQNGAFVWDGNRVKFSPAGGWATDTTYAVEIAAGVASVAGGLPSAKDFTTAFVTVPSKVLLDIALDYQDKPLSCEAAALKMALAGKGVKVSENEIMAVVGYDTTSVRGKTWGDPDAGFVGNISGRQNTTGYGVHWSPIARAANRWRSAESFIGWTTTQLATAIAAGQPVVIWGVLGRGYADPWVTPTGKTVAAWKGEHARTVIGFLGPAAAPTHFILNDPIVGRVTWSAATLRRDWGKFNNSGVVVY